MRSRKGPSVALLALSSSFLLSSCSFFHDNPPRFQQQDEAGSVHVTVQSVAPFESYISSLQPQFPLSSQDAIAEAIIRTGCRGPKSSAKPSASEGLPAGSHATTRVARRPVHQPGSRRSQPGACPRSGQTAARCQPLAAATAVTLLQHAYAGASSIQPVSTSFCQAISMCLSLKSLRFLGASPERCSHGSRPR
jgi:hypothetical protein